MQKTIEIEIDRSVLKIETHRWAKQANGSAVLTLKDNVTLVTANMKEDASEDKGFFPLLVDYRENNYAGGKIPGGFFKREGKPSEREVLLSRLIDRPMRPLFPDNFLNDTQVIALLMSADFSIDYDSLGIIGASAALLSSTIPFTTPVGAIKIGWKKEGEFLVNPGRAILDQMDMVIQVAGTEEDIVMLEALGREFDEDILKQGLIIAKEHISRICEAQKELINPDKIEVPEDTELAEIFQSLKSKYEERLVDAIFTEGKQERSDKTRALSDEILEGIEDEAQQAKYKRALHNLESQLFRETLLKEKKRNDGRAFDEIRDITIELGVLPRVHGSAVFTRGETQAMAAVTLGSEDDAQRIDELGSSEDLKKFMLHYNFPPFSVGEVSFLRGAGRREIGHGVLAEKALRIIIPPEEEFPYTIRIVSDILESNGSSSMATVCGGTLALMNAGVPISAPVAGIAMGLIKEDDDYVILTDIAGFEDHFGDMDFKIAGTEKGLTAVQLDIKIKGLSDEIIDSTLAESHKARMFILAKMKESISVPAKELSEYAPVILTMHIKTDKIKDLIGPGGKTIKELISTHGVKINTEDDGKVTVAAPNMEVAKQVEKRIKDITATAEVGKVYKGKITRIEDYGVFVEILNGEMGLLHISEISNRRLKTIQEARFRIGQVIDVKVIGIDRENRIKVSKKVLEYNKDHDREDDREDDRENRRGYNRDHNRSPYYRK
jgi:polyribonucleotide nucleotidyltransferase